MHQSFRVSIVCYRQTDGYRLNCLNNINRFSSPLDKTSLAYWNFTN